MSVSLKELSLFSAMLKGCVVVDSVSVMIYYPVDRGKSSARLPITCLRFTKVHTLI